MCNFCDLSINRYEREKVGGAYSPSVFIEKYNDEHKLIAIGDDTTTFKIICCPICERKL